MASGAGTPEGASMAAAAGAPEGAATPEVPREGAAGAGSASRAELGAWRGHSPEVVAGASRAAGDAEEDGTC